MRLNLRELSEAASYSPKQALLDAVGDLSPYKPAPGQILVATYVSPGRIMKGFEAIGGLIRTDRNVEEDRFQGKVGLVLKMGPLTFHDNDEQTKFGGFSVKVGDWVMFQPSNGWEFFIRDRRKDNEGVSVRLIEDVFIKMDLDDPNLVY